MRKIILVGHGEGCEGMKKSAEMILGKQSQLAAVSLNENESPEDYKKKVEKVIFEAEREKYEEFLFLSDIKGGTPTNIVVMISKEYQLLSLVSGYHLAMILTACTNNEIDVIELIKESSTMIQKII